MADDSPKLKLEQAVGKLVTVKLAAFQKAFNCKLISLEDHGIWIASKELSEQIRDSGVLTSALPPRGYPKTFVPYARLDWLVHLTD